MHPGLRNGRKRESHSYPRQLYINNLFVSLYTTINNIEYANYNEQTNDGQVTKGIHNILCWSRAGGAQQPRVSLYPVGGRGRRPREAVCVVEPLQVVRTACTLGRSPVSAPGPR